MRRRRATSGATLIEIMISLVIVLVGMLALFKVLSTAVVGSSTASKLSQAQTRAMTILESIRHSPKVALSCLSTTPNPSNWKTCEQTCLSQLTNQKWDSCIYTIDRFSVISGPDPTGANPYATGPTGGQFADRNQQNYVVDAKSAVTIAGPNNNVFDVDITVGWNDDGSASTSAGYHSVRVRTGVFP
jgi:type II secretory pathway pseudopilin PulG